MLLDSIIRGEGLRWGREDVAIDKYRHHERQDNTWAQFFFMLSTEGKQNIGLKSLTITIHIERDHAIETATTKLNYIKNK